MRWPHCLGTGAFALIVGCGRSGAQSPQPADAMAYKLTNGPYSVATADVLLHDGPRNKDLPVTVVYPKTGGLFPVIVFSHGLYGSGHNYGGLTHYWAGHGYVVLQPTHADSLTLRRSEGERKLREMFNEPFEDPTGWKDRIRDITFTMDSFDELERRIPALQGKIDRRHIGVGGHSYGAFTSELIGGTTIDLPNLGRNHSFADNRAQAILLLSGQGHTGRAITEHSWKQMMRPTMVMTGTNDPGRKGQGPEWRLEPFRLAPPGDKYGLLIDGANHFSFTGEAAERSTRRGRLRRAQGGDKTAIARYIRMASLAFWDAYLKGDAGAKTWLQSDALPTYSRNAVKLWKK